MSKKLIEQDFISAAKKLRCEIASVKAVAEIESRGNGFYADGFPTLLFERHVFRKYTQGRYNKSHPHLSGPQGNYGAGGQNQRNKFNEAFALNPAAAMMACSWGKFQLMGFNHAVCGFATIDEFVDAMKESEGKHLFGFVNFVINNNLADELRAKNWAKFAKGYNGAGYKKNNYDVKLAAAYRKYAAQKVSAVVPATNHATKNQPAETDNSAEIPSVLTPEAYSNEQPPNDLNADEASENLSEQTKKSETIIEKVERYGDTVKKTSETITDFQNNFSPISKTSWAMVLVSKVFGLVLLVFAWAKDNWFELLIAFGLIVLAAWLYSKAKDRAVQKTLKGL